MKRSTGVIERSVMDGKPLKTNPNRLLSGVGEHRKNLARSRHSLGVQCLVELVRRNLNPHLRLCGLLLTMYDARTNLSQQVADEVRAHFSNTFETIIPRSVRLSEAPSHGLPIAKYDPSSRASRAYDELAREIIAGTRTEVPA